MDLRPFLFNALENNAHLFAGTTPEQLGAPSPCEDWDVKSLMNHMVGGLWMFAGSLHGEEPLSTVATIDRIGDDPVKAFDEARKAATDAWSEDGALERTITIRAGTMPAPMALRVALTEAIVHGWDLASATGQKHGIDPMIATAMLDGLRKMVTDDFRGPGKAFQSEIELPADAPIEKQLVAFLGRKP